MILGRTSCACYTALAALGLCVLTTQAATRTWNKDTSGNFSDPANWTGGVPGADDTALFRRGDGVSYSTVMGSSPTVDRLVVGSNTVTLDTNLTLGVTLTADNPITTATGRGLVVGELATDTAAVLNLSPPLGHSFVVSLSAVAATIGDAAGSGGTLNVPGGVVNLTGAADMIIGHFGAGALNVSDGADVNVTNSAGNVILGDSAFSSGSATVSGSSTAGGNSRFSLGGMLDVGRLGDGSLAITNGGMVSNTFGTIGRLGRSSGLVVVDGYGSTWTNSDALVVGKGGAGSLTITNGGMVTSDGGAIGELLGSTGSVVIDGPGSKWTVSQEDALVTNGSLTITNYGTFARGPSGPGTISRLLIAPSGTLRGDGSVFFWPVINSGRVEPGNSTGVLTIIGPYEQDPAGRLRIDLAGPTNHDQLLVYGSASLDGTLELVHQPGYNMQVGDSFDILVTNIAEVMGQFGSVLTSSLAGVDFGVSVTYSPFQVTVTVTDVQPLPGDYNRNGFVDAADYVVWRNTLGQPVTPFSGADGDGDGMVDPDDYNVWMAHFGQTILSAASAAAGLPSSAVPEPATSAMLLLATAVAFAPRRARFRRQPN